MNKVKVINESNNPLPSYGSEGASGFDIRAYLSEPLTLKPLGRKIIPTGLKFGLPKGKELQIRPRSGMTINHGITVLNSPGTVDHDFTGEVGLIMINLSEKNYTIESGDRIAQGVIMESLGKQGYELVEYEGDLDETERGSNGFGSTGKN